jgi:hypothetical protein
MSLGGPESVTPEDDDDPPAPLAKVPSGMWPDSPEPKTPQPKTPEPKAPPPTPGSASIWPLDAPAAAGAPSAWMKYPRDNLAPDISEAEAMALWEAAQPTVTPEEVASGPDRVPPPQPAPTATAAAPPPRPMPPPPRPPASLGDPADPPPVLSALRGLLLRSRNRSPE